MIGGIDMVAVSMEGYCRRYGRLLPVVHLNAVGVLMLERIIRMQTSETPLSLETGDGRGSGTIVMIDRDNG